MTVLARLGVVSTSGVPPSADTRNKPPFRAVAKTMVPSPPQLAPKSAAALHSVTAGPPARGTFLSSPAAPKPTHRPSGEKKGLVPPLVPGIGVTSSRSILRA